MSLVCGISHEVPRAPVFCRVSGMVYERSLAEKYIAEHGTEPTTGASCTVEDLADIQTKSMMRPRPPAATSIPSLLRMLQDEWEAIALETFTLKKHLEITRQELSHSLYQHDAACRVIARVTKERDSARSALASVSAAPAPVAAGPANNQMDADPRAASVPASVIAKISSVSDSLQAQRKKRPKHPADLVSADQIASFKEVSSHPGLHSASAPGVLALALHPTRPTVVLTGGADGKAVLYDFAAQHVLASLKGHTKRVTDVLLHPTQDFSITASGDATVRVWSNQEPQSPIVTFSSHKAEVTAVSLHPTQEHLVSSGLDGAWGLHDIVAARTLLHTIDESRAVLHCVRVHPDGLILATGAADGRLRIWDVREAARVADENAHAAVMDISFSENGYYMATAGGDNAVRLWDLRKLENIKTFDTTPDFNLRSVAFDRSGNYLAAAGNDLRIYMNGKPWRDVVRWSSHQAPVTRAQFGPNAQFVASVSMDRTLKIHAL